MIVTLMSPKHVPHAHHLYNINVIKQMHWILFVDNAQVVKQIVSLIRTQHAMNAIQFNQWFQNQHINAIRVMNLIQSAENVRLMKKIVAKMLHKHVKIAQLHFNTSVTRRIH